MIEIEAKPKLSESYVRRQIDHVVGAYTLGCNKEERDKWLAFVETCKRVFLEDMQCVAEIAFNKGREYERNQGGQQK